ncbi:glycosyltransferase [Hyphobacterium sp. CCMP332]|nr:glycosyltransferase [Hyphobacterium sp. CCMP332]
MRNELENIPNLLLGIEDLFKNSKNFELILIDDNSVEATLEKLKEWHDNFENKDKIEILSIKDGIPSKKKAISKALEKAKYHWIVQTDADCEITSTWFNSIRQKNNDKYNLIAGPVIFKTEGFWSSLLTVESWALVLISYLGFQKEKPQMCSAANLCWDRSVLKNQAYSEIIEMEVPSGDDAYLLNYYNSVYPKKNYYEWSRGSLLITRAPRSFAQFVNQRLRWASKWGAIKGLSQRLFPIALWVYHFLHISLILALSLKGYFQIVLIVILLKALLEMKMLNEVAKNFEHSINLLYVLVLQFLYSPYVVIFGLLSQFAVYRWKNVNR